MQPIFIKENEILSGAGPFMGIGEFTTDELLASKIFAATGDLAFKGFLPHTWKKDAVIKQRFAVQQLQTEKKPLTVFNMQMKAPGISAAAHDYFLKNYQNVKGLIPDDIQLPTLKSLNPLFIAAGLAAAAVLFISIKPYLPKGKKNE